MLTVLEISGMNAVHAVRAVETALGGLPGVVRTTVTLGTAEVEHEERVTPAELIAAVAVAGFEVARWRQERRRLPML